MVLVSTPVELVVPPELEDAAAAVVAPTTLLDTPGAMVLAMNFAPVSTDTAILTFEYSSATRGPLDDLGAARRR
jgi:hypothetical protein